MRSSASILPGGAPLEGARAAATRFDRFAELLICIPILSVTFIAKFAVPVGSHKIALALPIFAVLIIAGMALGRMKINTGNFIFYVVLVAALMMLQVLSGNALSDSFSSKSLALFMCFHAPYCFELERGLTRPDFQFRFFQYVAAILAICGLVQMAVQIGAGQDYAFPIETYVPKDFQDTGFANLVPLTTGSHLFKSNGIFLLEPSFFSQMMCIAIIIELLYYGRLVYLGLFAAGVLVAYSGTGPAILAALFPFWVIQKRRFGLVIGGAIGLVIAYFVAADALHLDIYMERLSELSTQSSETSGYERFIAPFVMLDQWIWPSIHNTLLGLGAGSFEPYVSRSWVKAWDSTWAKMIFEYGIIGFVIYAAFMIRCLMKGGYSLYLKSALLVHLFVVSGNLVAQPHGLNLSLICWPTQEPKSPVAANEDEPTKS